VTRARLATLPAPVLMAHWPSAAACRRRIGPSGAPHRSAHCARPASFCGKLARCARPDRSCWHGSPAFAQAQALSPAVRFPPVIRTLNRARFVATTPAPPPSATPAGDRRRHREPRHRTVGM